jgi:hypothetical protein
MSKEKDTPCFALRTRGLYLRLKAYDGVARLTELSLCVCMRDLELTCMFHLARELGVPCSTDRLASSASRRETSAYEAI